MFHTALIEQAVSGAESLRSSGVMRQGEASDHSHWTVLHSWYAPAVVPMLNNKRWESGKNPESSHPGGVELDNLQCLAVSYWRGMGCLEQILVLMKTWERGFWLNGGTCSLHSASLSCVVPNYHSISRQDKFLVSTRAWESLVLL